MNALRWHLHQWARRLGMTGLVGLGLLAAALLLQAIQVASLQQATLEQHERLAALRGGAGRRRRLPGGATRLTRGFD
ncbi:MAG: hypothetical protein K0M48_05550 [Thiobacillus sp.]|nr:hypothetical protein [Thiobacillus sp.]